MSYLMTDEEYQRACGFVPKHDVGWDYQGAFQRRRDEVLGRRVRETLILAGLGKDADIPDPETVRALMLRASCTWCMDDDGVWHTGCGHAWQFECGGMAENGTKWCQFCGGLLAVVAKD